jgi:flavin-dependent dehydrogenase
VGDPRYFDSVPGNLDDKLKAIIPTVPRLRERLGQSEFVFPARTFQNYSLSCKQLYGPQFALLGNAAGFLDPVFSSGVTLALESASRAVQLMLREFKGETVDWQTDYQEYMLLGFKVFRSYVEGWYDGTLPQIVYAPQVDDLIKRQISSVLSGYVWDRQNPMVKDPQRTLSLISELLKNRM